MMLVSVCLEMTFLVVPVALRMYLGVRGCAKDEPGARAGGCLGFGEDRRVVTQAAPMRTLPVL
jgi:hypothetical protein